MPTARHCSALNVSRQSQRKDQQWLYRHFHPRIRIYFHHFRFARANSVQLPLGRLLSVADVHSAVSPVASQWSLLVIFCKIVPDDKPTTADSRCFLPGPTTSHRFLPTMPHLGYIHTRVYTLCEIGTRKDFHARGRNGTMEKF